MIINLRLNINGSDITVEVIEPPKPVVEKERLHWLKSPNGSFALCRPSEHRWGRGAYVAYGDGQGVQADASVCNGAGVNRCESYPTMAERVAKIIEWAEEDGYKVPACPFEIPVEVPPKPALVWDTTILGGYGLRSPGQHSLAYIAYGKDDVAETQSFTCAKAGRSHRGGTLAERVGLIALWARMDGFEVPPLPVVKA